MLNFLLKKNAIPSDSKAAIMKAIATRCSPVSHLHPSIANKIANLSQPAQGKSQHRAEGTRRRLQYAVPRERIKKNYLSVLANNIQIERRRPGNETNLRTSPLRCH